MATYKAINWNPNELLGEAKMDTMTGNMDYLFNATPRATYTLPSGLTRNTGVRMAAGRVTISPRASQYATASVRFGNFFTTGCQPIVTTSIVSNWQPRLFCVISGIGQVHPDYRGFTIHFNVAAEQTKNDKILHTAYVGWHAMGY